MLPCIEYIHAGVHKYRATGRLGDYMCGGVLIFVGLQCTICLMSPFWHPEFLVCSWVFENFAPLNIYIYIYIYVCVCVCVCVHTHTHTKQVSRTCEPMMAPLMGNHWMNSAKIMAIRNILGSDGKNAHPSVFLIWLQKQDPRF